MQVRYQAALHPEYLETPRPRDANDNPSARIAKILFLEELQDFFEFGAQLLDDLLTLRGVLLCRVAGKLLARTGDGEALVVQQAANLPDHDDVMTLVVAAVAAPLHGLELRKLLLPVTQYVR